MPYELDYLEKTSKQDLLFQLIKDVYNIVPEGEIDSFLELIEKIKDSSLVMDKEDLK